MRKNSKNKRGRKGLGYIQEKPDIFIGGEKSTAKKQAGAFSLTVLKKLSD